MLCFIYKEKNLKFCWKISDFLFSYTLEGKIQALLNKGVFTMNMDKQTRRIFRGKFGKEALKGLERYGVEDLSEYTPWQLKFYVMSPLPWPQCDELFKQYKEYCSEHRFMRFDTWYATVNGNPVRDGGEDFDYSAYDDPSEQYINYSWGEPLDKVNCEDETVEIDC